MEPPPLHSPIGYSMEWGAPLLRLRWFGAASRWFLMMDHMVWVKMVHSTFVIYFYFVHSSRHIRPWKTNRGSRTAFDKLSEPDAISAPVIEERIDLSGPWLPPDTGSSYSYSVPVNHCDLESTQNLTDAPKLKFLGTPNLLEICPLYNSLQGAFNHLLNIMQFTYCYCLLSLSI